VEVFSPGNFLCIDESMSYWLGLEGQYSLEGMAHVTKMKGKPRGVGLMLKSIADGETGLLLRLEIQEGKEPMKHKEFQQARRNTGPEGSASDDTRSYPFSTAVTLRLSKPWFGTKRTVVGDSAFASVETLLALRRHDLHFMGCVKTAHTGFCKGFLQEWAASTPRPDRGSHLCCVSPYVENGRNQQMLAVGWLDKKLKTFVSSRGTTLEGTPSKRPRHKIVVNEAGQLVSSRIVKEVKRPRVVEDLYKYFSAIDVHNHYRQGSLRIEDNWKTKTWTTRVFSTIIGMIATNAYLAYRYEHKVLGSMDDLLDFKDFLKKMAFLLVKGAEGSASMGLKRSHRNMIEEVSASTCIQTFITPLIFAGK
jgi:hypothetical protein